MNFETLLFFVVAAGSVAAALLMITSSNPVQSALFLILNFFCLAVLYLLLTAQFIAIIQIVVYAGAIMVLFLFVIMLLNLADDRLFADRGRSGRTVALILSIAVLLEIMLGVMAA